MIYLSMHSSVQTSAKNSPIGLKGAARLCSVTENMAKVGQDGYHLRVGLDTGEGISRQRVGNHSRRNQGDRHSVRAQGKADEVRGQTADSLSAPVLDFTTSWSLLWPAPPLSLLRRLSHPWFPWA